MTFPVPAGKFSPFPGGFWAGMWPDTCVTLFRERSGVSACAPLGAFQWRLHKVVNASASNENGEETFWKGENTVGEYAQFSEKRPGNLRRG